MLPGRGAPRWLLPKKDHSIDAVLASWSPYRLRSQLKWRAIRAANRAGILSALPGIHCTSAAGIDDIDWRNLGWQGNQPPVIAVYIGTPGPSRKAVFHLADPRTGACRLIVKVPVADGAKPAILHEADVLNALAAENCRFAPGLVSVDRERGIAAQTVLGGPPGRREFTFSYRALLLRLVLKGETTTIAQHAEKLREQMSRAVVSDSTADTLAFALSQLSDEQPLPACWVHGDFTPWNLKHLTDGNVGLLDWEEAHRGGPPLQDGFHFLHMQDYLFRSRPAVHSRELEQFAGSYGLSGDLCHKLEILYLASSYLNQQAREEYARTEFLVKTLQLTLGERHFRQPQSVSLTAPA